MTTITRNGINISEHENCIRRIKQVTKNGVIKTRTAYTTEVKKLAALNDKEKEDLLNEFSDSILTRLIKANVLNTPKRKVDRVSWERILTQEWAMTNYLNYPKWYRQGVGDYRDAGKSLTYAKLRQYADVIIMLEDKFLIVEGKMNPKPNIVSQLQHYIDIFPQTPEFLGHKDKKIEGIVVAAMDVQDVRDMCARYGLGYELFRPSNFEAWYAKYILKNTVPEAEPTI